MSTKRKKMRFYTPALLSLEEYEAVCKLAEERSCSKGAVLRWAVRVALISESKSKESESLEITGTGAAALQLELTKEEQR